MFGSEGSAQPALTQIIYASMASRVFEHDELDRMVCAAETSNRRVGITGVLIHDRGSFLQAIEGPTAAVETLFERIADDFRHARVSLIAKDRIAERSFPGRPIVFLPMTPAELTDATGVDEFLMKRSGFQRLSLGTIRALLAVAGERRKTLRFAVVA